MWWKSSDTNFNGQLRARIQCMESMLSEWYFQEGAATIPGDGTVVKVKTKHFTVYLSI
jgi:hypothetical protein